MMKKNFLIFLIIFILIINFITVLAENISLENNENNLNYQEEEIFKKIKLQTDERITKEISEKLEKPLRIIFRIEDQEKIEISKAVILMVLLILVLLFVHLIVKLIPEIFGTGFSAMVVKIILVLIGTSTGIVYKFANQIILMCGNLTNSESPFIKMMITLIFLMFILGVGSWGTKYIKKEESRAELENKGSLLGRMVAKEKIQALFKKSRQNFVLSNKAKDTQE